MAGAIRHFGTQINPSDREHAHAAEGAAAARFIRSARAAAAAVIALTAAAIAQPVLTPLSGGGGTTPKSMSNPQGGAYYVAGYGGRWTLNHGAATFTSIASAATQISADGAYQSALIANNGVISGGTAGILPAFGIPGTFTPFTFASASDTIAGRYSATTSSFVGLPGFPNNAYSQSYQVFGSGDSPPNIHSPMGMSQNGRFIVVQGYVTTYNSSAQSVTITDITPSGGVATVTTSSAHLLAVGNQVTITGSDVPAYNAAVTVTGVPSATTFTFATTSPDEATVGTLSFAPGTRVYSLNTFKFRGGIWDANTNTMRLLPTPFRTTSQTTRRRDGSAFAVSDDGSVIVGAQEPTQGTTSTSADPDGGRLVVYRWNGSDYVMSYLPNGVNASGYPWTYSISAGQVFMNATGTIIVGPAISNAGAPFIGKWTWNAVTSSWGPPISLGANVNPSISITTIGPGDFGPTVTTATPHGLALYDHVYITGNSVAAYNGLVLVTNVPDATSFAFSSIGTGIGNGGVINKAASWLPSYIRDCGSAIPSLKVTGMSNDGNTVVGSMAYSANPCGDFSHTAAQAGWIWTAANGYMEDWYDHLNGLGIAGLALGQPFGPTTSDSPPLLGGPTAISPDGTAFAGWIGAPTVGAVPWILASTSSCGSADFNCDGDVGTDADIEAFFACLSGSCPQPPCASSADFNGDGDVGTDADIEAFFRILGGGAC